MAHHLASLWERRARRLLSQSLRYAPGDALGERLLGQAQALQSCAEQLVGRLETESHARDQASTVVMPRQEALDPATG